ncbi:MAG: signal peptide peptidase SppA [Syntrophomonadaceae bacterium]|nr:signal peptide peptidase SppA [Syntrophomonadaceae bacterium]MDD3022896.1 signal peptide peptidase SppA [Syntrophomonadaceae bacterium]
MQKKIVVGVFVVFLLVMGSLAVINAQKLEKAAGGSKAATIGVIEINGAIGGGTAWLAESGASSSDIMQAIRLAGERKDIKAVVLRVDSPGGTSGASQEIAIELDRLRNTGKPVITSMGDMCASGGYWIACSTDRIVANGATITGSIGVIMQLSNLEGLYDKLGIRNSNIKSGEHKDMGSTDRELTADEQIMLQEMVDDSYQQFLDQVRKGRKGKIKEEKLLEIADGRIFTGRQAKQLGLVDSLGNYYDAVKTAENMAGLKGDSNIEILNGANLWDRFMLNMGSRSLLPNQELAGLKFITR